MQRLSLDEGPFHYIGSEHSVCNIVSSSQAVSCRNERLFAINVDRLHAAINYGHTNVGKPARKGEFEKVVLGRYSVFA
jgi:hypothetical protein